MFSSFIIKSLITKTVRTDSQIVIQGSRMTFNQPSDFENEEELLNEMKNSNIDTIRLEGSGFYTLPKFSGIQLVQTFECDLDCGIPEYYFYRNNHIKNVYLGEKVSPIGRYAFSYSTLESIEIQGSTYIENNAFSYCHHLTTFPTITRNFEDSAFSFSNISSITLSIIKRSYYYHPSIGRSAFAGCYNLETVNFNMSLFSIEESAFYDCYNLKNLIFLPNYEISSIGSLAFENCPIESFNFSAVSVVNFAAFRNTKFKNLELYSNEIYGDAFSYCSDLLEVKIKDQLKLKEQYLQINNIFSHCVSLVKVDLGPLTEICSGMFSHCYNLKEVKSTNENLVLNSKSFFSCLSLKSINLSISIIKEQAFMFCKSLTSIYLTATEIKSRAFYGCQNLVNVGPQVFGGEYAFAFCSSIKSCNVQTFAGIGLMMNCSNLESVTIHNIQYLPERMFFGCSKLKNVVFPDIIKTIGHYAFMGTAIEVDLLDLSETEEIGNYAFKGAKIQKLKLGRDYIYYRFTCNTMYVSVCDGAYDTDENPFKDVTTITEITIGSEITQFRAKDFQDSSNVKIILESGSKFQIENGMMIKEGEVSYYIPSTSSKTLTIPNSITSILPYAFASSKLETIEINHYIEILEYAFTGCKYLKSVTINFDEQSKKLDNGIFENCIALTTVNLCNNFNKYGNKCFRKCTAIETFVIAEGIESIGMYCFAECSSLKKIEFPSNNIYISGYCFYKCTGFSHLSLSKSNIQYGENVYDSTNIKSVAISHSLSSGMFNMCKQLEKVTFTNYIYSIPSYCFNSTNISEINIPFSVTELGSYCFAFTKLKKFVILKSLTSIHPQAFYGVEDLQLELGCDHPKYLLGSHELIDKDTKTLILTYGKLLSTYVVPAIVTEIGSNAINSYPKINEKTGKVIDFGVTTLVIRTKIIINSNPIFNAPYLHNLCYGGTTKVDGFNDVPRIFVSNNYRRSIWNQGPYKDVIFGECDSAVPFENYAKFDFTYPTNPKYIELPNDTIPSGSEECPIIDIPLGVPEPEPVIISQDEEESSTSSQINSEYVVIKESTSSQLIEFEQATPSKTAGLLLYILIGISVFEIVFIVWLVSFLISKSKEQDESDKSFVEVSEHVITGMSQEVTLTNPLFSMRTTMNDDPFADDFEERKDTFEGYYIENCLVDE